MKFLNIREFVSQIKRNIINYKIEEGVDCGTLKKLTTTPRYSKFGLHKSPLYVLVLGIEFAPQKVHHV